MSQSIDALHSNLLATYNAHNQSIGGSNDHVVTHQSSMESIGSWLGPVMSQHQYYSANLYNEVQPTLASGSNFQSFPHPLPAPVPHYTCKIGVGCPLLLECTTTSIRSHLRGHGHVHKDRERSSCPWQGCGKEMCWKNVARHIKEIHLGERLPCRKCGRGFSRKETWEVHTNKCNLFGA